MALSNIWREPQREITESVVGVGAFGALIGLDALFSLWVVPTPERSSANIFGAMLVGLVLAMILLMLAILTHWIGEEICDALANRGVELRPRDRHPRPLGFIARKRN